MQLEPRRQPEIPEHLNADTLARFMPPAADALGQFGPQQYEYFERCGDLSFDVNGTQYSRINAWYLADVALLSYSDCLTIEEVVAEVTPPLMRFFRAEPHVKVFLGSAQCWGVKIADDAIQCMVAHDDALGLVAFRGTLPKHMGNWLTDAEFMLVEESGPAPCLVHHGFQLAIDCLWQGMEGLGRYLDAQALAHPGVKWWFTGHSLGAAMATLAVRRFGRAQGLYTHGSPRVGNQAFVDQVTQSVVSHYRIVNHHDIVTQVPFFPPFEHAGKLIQVVEHRSAGGLSQLLNHIELPIDLTAPFDAELAHFFDDMGQLKSSLEEHGLLRACLDHAPIFYSKLLWNALAAEYAAQPSP